MIETVPVCADDQPFLFHLFSTTRFDEISSWGFDQKMAEQFLRMQWEAQTQSYQFQFPAMDHRIILADNKNVGRIIVEMTSHVLHLVDISLLPALRNQGIGTRMLQELQREAVQQKKTLSLSVLVSNPAKRLYDRLGFSVVSQDEVYVRMEWRG
ncbi:GNAT family N-acetyltransferase [Brevibacillus choshinensis]|uniref:GNAT family N-acetyltransferase n=1 Tax=Brevibacillus choshinensis TaxID=54911 RepID=UPI002E1E0DA9|nr:GNAT family N-acetyltransferase [Brevibacillus choshinensis]